MTDYAKALDNLFMPDRIKALPIDPRGFPVPWFVATVDGAYDFRVADQAKLRRCVRQRRCWVCGQPLGSHLAFPIGPMCSVNRVSSEPPSHRECAEFAVKACPFLTQPRMRRNEKGLPGDAVDPPGEMIRRNPGVTAIWITKSYALTRERLFNIGPAEEVTWWCQGRPATRLEVELSISTGLPLLEADCEREATAADRAAARGALKQMVKAATVHLPGPAA